ncbi:unnamed protein product [Echinostoma caproni]|uniref:Reverse transcriptase domain-containing protein n=1 Tax=Echinostoma caproni TaxID=27848 RepID=A0A183API7_9TREM|nr:unnamed protein product [Echinostoma caproni]
MLTRRKLLRNTNHLSTPPTHHRLSCSAPLLSWQAISVDEVCDALLALEPYQSPGPDGLHPIVVKEMTPVIAPTLAVLFEQSLTERRLPTEWKTAIVRPLFEGGALEDPVNYRPVSLTCVTVQVMERVLAKRLRAHLIPNDLLCSAQHGFRPQRFRVSDPLLIREQLASAKATSH